ncbi:hypothetical protein D3C80_1020320 [compost metagenome]
MRGLAGFKHVGNQHRVVETLHNDAVAFHQQIIIFEVLGDFQNRRVLKKVLQTLQRLGKRHLPFGEPDAIAEKITTRTGLVRQRNVGRADIGARSILAIIGNRQRKTDKFRLHRIKRSRFRIECNDTCFTGCRNPAVQCREVPDGRVGARINPGG